jgi:hypothetical protein
VRVDLASGQTERVACGAGHFTEIAALGVTDDGSTLVSTGQSVYDDPTFVWDALTGAPLDIPPPTNLKTPSPISPDGTLMAALADDGPDFDLVDTATGKIVKTFGPAPTRPESFDFSPSAALIASDSERDPVDRRVNPVGSLWDVGGGTLIQRLPLITNVPLGLPEPVLFAPDGLHLFAGGYSTSALWCR